MKSRGFTLIELMLAVAIIGILAVVAIPRYSNLVRKSWEATTRGNLGVLRSAVTIYYGDNEGMWPRPRDPDNGDSIYGHVDLASVLVSKYISAIPAGRHWCEEIKENGGTGRWDENCLVRSYKPSEETGWGCWVGFVDDAGVLKGEVGWSYCPDSGKVYLHCRDNSSSNPGAYDLEGTPYCDW